MEQGHYEKSSKPKIGNSCWAVGMITLHPGIVVAGGSVAVLHGLRDGRLLGD